jgi:hypothetical protein
MKPHLQNLIDVGELPPLEIWPIRRVRGAYILDLEGVDRGRFAGSICKYTDDLFVAWLLASGRMRQIGDASSLDGALNHFYAYSKAPPYPGTGWLTNRLRYGKPAELPTVVWGGKQGPLPCECGALEFTHDYWVHSTRRVLARNPDGPPAPSARPCMCPMCVRQWNGVGFGLRPRPPIPTPLS